MKLIHNIRVLLVIIFISSCQGESRTKKEEPGPNKTENELSYFALSTAEIDTLASPQAPANITRTFHQDSKGNIWIATFSGVIKYDGQSFTNITKDISPARFFTVFEDRKGNFWFASVGAGVFYYDGKTFGNFTTKEGLANDRVTNIYEDEKGNIWFGTEGGISIYDGKSFRNITNKHGITSNDINSIIEDKNGKFWIGTRGVALIYDPKTSSFTKIGPDPMKSFENVRHITQDSKGNIWLAGKDGLWRYNYKTFQNYSNAFAGYVYEDDKGNIWSTENDQHESWKLSLYKNAITEDHVVPPSTIMANQQMLFGILEDNNGNIWYGALNGAYRYNGKAVTYFKEARYK